jgi:hypothetical protein
MSQPHPAEAALLFQALAAPHGIAVQSNDARGALERLERLRQKLASEGNEELRELRIALNPAQPLGEVFLVKKQSKSNGAS